MKATFTAENPQEIQMLSKANDMALFIWELVNNGWREFKHTGYDYEKAWNKIRALLEEYKIDIDSLVE